MNCHTKTGLLLLMISAILAILSAIVSYSIWFSIEPLNMASNGITSVFVGIPAAIVGGIGGLIGLIGAILMLIGRKEFGETHRKFIFYAVLLVVISMIITVIFTIVIAATTYSYISQTISNGSENIGNALLSNNFFTLIFFITPISASIGGLIWVFALYQLEDTAGKMVLFAAFVCIVITAVVVSMSSMMFFEEFFNSANFQDAINSNSVGSSSYSQLISNYQWIGTTGLFSLVGNVISNLLLVFALYIPYIRITSGELVPVTSTTKSSEPDRRCPNCGQSIPFDANICPYCSKRFEDYL